jgi:hypothetical protein
MIIEGLAGVLTGLVGNLITSFTNLKTQKLKNEHEVAMIEAETKAMQAEAAMQIKVTETAVAGELAQLEETNYGENLKAVNKPSLNNKILEKLFETKWTAWVGTFIAFWLGFIDVLKGIMRPGLTLYLVALTSWITYNAYDILLAKQELMDVASALGLFNRVVDIIIYLTVSVVTWWFADRRVAKFLYRLNDGNIREK